MKPGREGGVRKHFVYEVLNTDFSWQRLNSIMFWKLWEQFFYLIIFVNGVARQSPWKKVWWIYILVHVDDILSWVECCAEKTREHKQYVVWWSSKRAWRVASVIYTQEATKYIQILKLVVWKCLRKCYFFNILGKLSYPSLSVPDFQAVLQLICVFFGHVHLNISMIRFRFSGILGQVLGWRNMPSEVYIKHFMDLSWPTWHPGKLTWNPKMEVWKMVFRFHVDFQGCSWLLNQSLIFLNLKNQKTGVLIDAYMYCKSRFKCSGHEMSVKQFNVNHLHYKK